MPRLTRQRSFVALPGRRGEARSSELGALGCLLAAACSSSVTGVDGGRLGTSGASNVAFESGAGATSDVPGAAAGAGGAATTPIAPSAGASPMPMAVAGASSVGGAAGVAGSAATGGASGTSMGGASAGGNGSAQQSDVIGELEAYLATPRDERTPLDQRPFATAPLGADDAERARQLVWDDYVAFVTETRSDENDDREIALDDRTLLYDFTTFGDMPENGHSLYLSLHGGGEADASVNDSQWENQKGLYQPDEGIYLAPRAPTDTWNLWHEAHIDPMFDRLITNLIVFEGVDPNRVYVMGYSAGGDGVYQLGPRMADRWAAAAMMAGHPNEAQPDSLRNVPFTIHVGGLDTAFDRNLVAEQWGELLDGLQAADSEGYEHYVEIHPDKPHWMDLEDAVAVPWMAQFTRDPVPSRVVWLQDDITHERSYWLAVHPEDAEGGTRIVGEYEGQSVRLESDDVSRIFVRLSDVMVDLDQPVSITAGDTVLYEGLAPRTVLTVWTTTYERGDPALVFSSDIEVVLP